MKEVTGLSAEKYLRHAGWDFVHPDYRPRAEAILAELKRGNLSHLARYRTLHKKGSHRWVEATVTGYLEDAGRNRTCSADAER